MHAGAISRANEAKRGVSEEIEPTTEKPKDLVAFFDDHHDVSAAMSKSRSMPSPIKISPERALFFVKMI